MYKIMFDGMDGQDVWNCERPISIFSLKKLFWIESSGKVPIVTQVRGVNDSSFSLSGKVVFSGDFQNDWTRFLNIIDFFNEAEYLYWTEPCEENYFCGCVGYYSPLQLRERLMSDYPHPINGAWVLNTQYIWETCSNLIEICLNNNYL